MTLQTEGEATLMLGLRPAINPDRSISRAPLSCGRSLNCDVDNIVAMVFENSPTDFPLRRP